MKQRFGHGAKLILLVSSLTIGCDSGKSSITTNGRSESIASSPPAVNAVSPKAGTVSTKKATNRPANLKGRVFIAEYHHIRDGKGAMFRTTSEFRSDLERFYRDGFRPVTVSQYLSNQMPLPPGASPMVFTFDDANPSQIRLLDDGSLDPKCAIGIWQKFAESHPDFPVRATFYVLPDVMWGQKKWVPKKIELLHSLGCELADHTITHHILSKLSDEKVKWEIGEAAQRLEGFGEKPPYSLAFPYGISPRNKELAKGFDYKGKRIELKAALLVGAEPARAPTDPKLNRYRIPRIQACKGPFGIDYWLDELEQGKVKPYVQ